MKKLYILLVLVLIGGLMAACVAAPAAAPQAPKALDKIVWVSPRGSLEVMDDANMWSSIELGYCKDLGIEVEMQPGPGEALAVVKLVGEGQANVGYPSPGVLTAGIDAGIPVIMAWEMMMTQVFDFALPKGSPIKSIKDLAGKKISVMSEGWSVIIDPMLVEAGVDPKSVKLLRSPAPSGRRRWRKVKPTRRWPGRAFARSGRPQAWTSTGWWARIVEASGQRLRHQQQ